LFLLPPALQVEPPVKQQVPLPLQARLQVRPQEELLPQVRPQEDLLPLEDLLPHLLPPVKPLVRRLLLLGLPVPPHRKLVLPQEHNHNKLML
jgi:hypothetical protein